MFFLIRFQKKIMCTNELGWRRDTHHHCMQFQQGKPDVGLASTAGRWALWLHTRGKSNPRRAIQPAHKTVLFSEAQLSSTRDEGREERGRMWPGPKQSLSLPSGLVPQWWEKKRSAGKAPAGSQLSDQEDVSHK